MFCINLIVLNLSVLVACLQGLIVSLDYFLSKKEALCPPSTTRLTFMLVSFNSEGMEFVRAVFCLVFR